VDEGDYRFVDCLLTMKRKTKNLQPGVTLETTPGGIITIDITSERVSEEEDQELKSEEVYTGKKRGLRVLGVILSPGRGGA